MCDQCGARHLAGWTHRILGEVALETNPAQVVPQFEKSIAIFRETKGENELALAYSGLGRYHKGHANVVEAREYLTRALEIFERLGTLLEPDKVMEELAELPEEG